MKKNKFLGIFALIIFILLILIMFILPDSLFLAIENTKTPMLPTGIKTPSNTKQEKTIADKFTQLKTTEYNYEYSLMYSENNETYTYKCTGTINGTKEKGNCTSPEEITYTAVFFFPIEVKSMVSVEVTSAISLESNLPSFD